jgi:phosphotriesterase-related protein
MCKHAVTVTGLVKAEDMGITLPHEHLLIEMMVRYNPSPEEADLGPQPSLADRWRILRAPAGYKVNLQGHDIPSAIVECGYFKAAGGKTIAELSSIGNGGDPVGLKKIAEETGLNIIAATGLYIAPTLPDWVRHGSVDTIADHLIADIETGGAEGIRRGAIGEIAVEMGTEVELKSVRAAGRAQARTGAPCFFHVASGILPEFRPLTDELIDLYVKEGGDLKRLVLCHQDGSGDNQAYQERLLAKGLWIEYDTFGSEGVFAFGERYIQLPTDSQRIGEIKALMDAGYSKQLLISQDICYQMSKRSWGGWGLAV